MATIRELTVFVSSPGDVPEERDAVGAVVARLNDRRDWIGRVALRARRWDHPDARVPMEAGRTPQDSVNRYLVRPSGCDVTVLILWGRLGTPLADVRRPDGSRYESGTAWELEDALAAGRPVFVFRRDEAPAARLGNPEQVRAAEQQYEAVTRFFAERFVNADGSLRGGVNTYRTVDDFTRQLETTLETWVDRLLRDESGGVAAAPGAPAVPRVPYMAPQRTARGYPLVRRQESGADGVVDDVGLVWSRVCAGRSVCLAFLPGVGKSTLAEEVVESRPLVLSRFEGVLWADVGRRPDRLQQYRRWAEALGVALPHTDAGGVAGPPECAAALRAAIGERRLLVVLDDVWDEQQAWDFMDLGASCVYIVTTRNRQLATALVAEDDVIPVRELSVDEGFALVQSIAPTAASLDPEGVRGAVASVGGLPLALVLVGMVLKRSALDRNDRAGIAAAIARVRQAGQLLNQHADRRDRLTLEEIIDVSWKELPDAARRDLARLSVLRSKPHGFDATMAREICGVEPADIRAWLAPMGLVEFKRNNDFTLHPIIAAYGRAKLDDAARRDIYASALAWYAQKLTGAVEEDPDAYRGWYRYEQADWQSTKDDWLYYLAACGDETEAMLAFLRVFFDAFWWWGYYQRFPFCERLVHEWQQRSLGEMQSWGLAHLLAFQDAYPEGPVKSGHPDGWRRAEEALARIRAVVGLGCDFDALPAGDAQRVRSFLDFFHAECLAYGRGDRAAALACYAAAHDQFVRAGVPWVPAWIRFYVGQYLLDVGDLAGAAEHTRRALEEADEAAALEQRDPELLANIHRALGDVHLAAGAEEDAAQGYARALCYAFAFQAVPEPPDAYTVEFHREVAGRVAHALCAERARSVDRVRRLAARLHHVFDAWWQAEGGALDDGALLAAVCGAEDGLAARLFPPVPTKEAVADRTVAAAFQARVRAVLPALCAAAGLRTDPAVDAGDRSP